MGRFGIDPCPSPAYACAAGDHQPAGVWVGPPIDDVNKQTEQSFVFASIWGAAGLDILLVPECEQSTFCHINSQQVKGLTQTQAQCWGLRAKI